MKSGIKIGKFYYKFVQEKSHWVLFVAEDGENWWHWRNWLKVRPNRRTWLDDVHDEVVDNITNQKPPQTN